MAATSKTKRTPKIKMPEPVEEQAKTEQETVQTTEITETEENAAETVENTEPAPVETQTEPDNLQTETIDDESVEAESEFIEDNVLQDEEVDPEDLETEDDIADDILSDISSKLPPDIKAEDFDELPEDDEDDDESSKSSNTKPTNVIPASAERRTPTPRRRRRQGAGQLAMSEKLAEFIESAIYRRTMLTGMLQAVAITKYGVFVDVLFDTGEEICTIKIPLDELGIDERITGAIERRVKTLAAGKTEKRKQRILNNEYRSYITSMLGAKVDFVPTQILRDMGVVIGNRAAAMERKRRNFRATRQNPVPSLREGSITRARVLIVTNRYITVEVSGYIENLYSYQITGMAVDLEEAFMPGDEIKVRIKSIIPGKHVRVESIDVGSNMVKTKVQEYKFQTRVLAKIMQINPRTGHYYLKMPNGCRGVAYYNKGIIKNNNEVHVGDMIYAVVVGRSKDGNSVRCDIRKVR